MQRIFRSHLTLGVLLGILLALGVAGGVSLFRSSRPLAAAPADNPEAKGEIHVIPLTKLKFGAPTKTLLKRDGIEIKAACILSFNQTGFCGGGDLPAATAHVARMYIENVSAQDAAAAVGGGDLDFGLCSEGPDYGDRHAFPIGQTLNIAVADCPGGVGACTLGDLAGAQGEGGSMGFVHQKNGHGLVVLHAMAGVNVLGADCAFAAVVDLIRPDLD